MRPLYDPLIASLKVTNKVTQGPETVKSADLLKTSRVTSVEFEYVCYSRFSALFTMITGILCTMLVNDPQERDDVRKRFSDHERYAIIMALIKSTEHGMPAPPKWVNEHWVWSVVKQLCKLNGLCLPGSTCFNRKWPWEPGSGRVPAYARAEKLTKTATVDTR